MLLFADLEAHANAAVLNQLSNVMVSIDGVLVPGVFRNPSAVASLGSMGATDTGPTLTVASSSVMAQPVEKQVVVAGTPYEILAAAPDGTGLTLLTLGCMQ